VGASDTGRSERVSHASRISRRSEPSLQRQRRSSRRSPLSLSRRRPARRTNRALRLLPPRENWSERRSRQPRPRASHASVLPRRRRRRPSRNIAGNRQPTASWSSRRRDCSRHPRPSRRLSCAGHPSGRNRPRSEVPEPRGVGRDRPASCWRRQAGLADRRRSARTCPRRPCRRCRRGGRREENRTRAAPATPRSTALGNKGARWSRWTRRARSGAGSCSPDTAAVRPFRCLGAVQRWAAGAIARAHLEPRLEPNAAHSCTAVACRFQLGAKRVATAGRPSSRPQGVLGCARLKFWP
jgi:hypothetical protein